MQTDQMSITRIADLFTLNWREMSATERIGYAGVEGDMQYIAESDDDEWQFVMDVNFKTATTHVQAFHLGGECDEVEGSWVEWAGLRPEFNALPAGEYRLNALRPVYAVRRELGFLHAGRTTRGFFCAHCGAKPDTACTEVS